MLDRLSTALADHLNEQGVDHNDVDCTLEEHHEGADRGGYVQVHRDDQGGVAYYDEGRGEWLPLSDEQPHRDPGELFVVATVSRGQIAKDLNDHLGRNETTTQDRLTPDDLRLTKEICQAYAGGLHVAADPGLPEGAREERLAELREQTLRACGIDPEDDED